MCVANVCPMSGKASPTIQQPTDPFVIKSESSNKLHVFGLLSVSESVLFLGYTADCELW